MSLSVGIVGLPNVGKSTLFNALLKKQQAYAANFPFATIEPNIGVVPVPDERLRMLAVVIDQNVGVDLSVDPGQTHRSVPTKTPIVPATVEFVDIAGLIAGAHKGEGLGNKFLAHIREVDAICHVVRDFSDPDIVKEGSVNPKEDLEIVETELILADLQTIENQKDPGNTTDKEEKFRWQVVLRIKETLLSNKPAREAELTSEESKIVRELSLLTSKPILVVLNVDENELSDAKELEKEFAKKSEIDESQVIAISAKIESQIAELTTEEQKDYMQDFGVTKSGLERVIKKAFETLNLINFLTAGEKEVRAWTIRQGTNAQQAAGVIHTDFEKRFIKADVIYWKDFVELGGWKKAREAGKVRQEGRDYVVKDGEVVEFKTGV